MHAVDGALELVYCVTLVEARFYRSPLSASWIRLRVRSWVLGSVVAEYLEDRESLTYPCDAVGFGFRTRRRFVRSDAL